MLQISIFYFIFTNNFEQFNFIENSHFLRDNIFNPKLTRVFLIKFNHIYSIEIEQQISKIQLKFNTSTTS
jgi:hypothetical protein